MERHAIQERARDLAATHAAVKALSTGAVPCYIQPLNGGDIPEDTPGFVFRRVEVEAEGVEFTNSFDEDGETHPTCTDLGAVWNFDTAAHPFDLKAAAEAQGLSVATIDDCFGMEEVFHYSSSDGRAGNATVLFWVEYATPEPKSD